VIQDLCILKSVILAYGTCSQFYRQGSFKLPEGLVWMNSVKIDILCVRSKKFSIRLTCQQKLSISVPWVSQSFRLHPPRNSRWHLPSRLQRGIARAIKTINMSCDAAVHSRTPTCAATKVEELQQSGEQLQQESRLAVPKLNLAIQMLQSQPGVSRDLQDVRSPRNCTECLTYKIFLLPKMPASASTQYSQEIGVWTNMLVVVRGGQNNKKSVSWGLFERTNWEVNLDWQD